MSVREKHAAIRKQLGCIPECAAYGPITHTGACPAAGKWLTDATTFPKAGTYEVGRTAVVPVSALEELVTKWRPVDGSMFLKGSADDARCDCADDVQKLIDAVTE